MSIFPKLLSFVLAPFRALRQALGRLNSKGSEYGGIINLIGLPSAIIGIIVLLKYFGLISAESDAVTMGDNYPELPGRPLIESPESSYSYEPETTSVSTAFDVLRLHGRWQPEEKLNYGTVRVDNGKGVLLDDQDSTVLEFAQHADGMLEGQVAADSSRIIDVFLQPSPEYGILLFVPKDPNDGDAFHWSWVGE